MNMVSKLTLERLAVRLLEAGALDIREVPKKVTNDQVKNLPKYQQPFLYSSGNWGCGYADVKGQAGNKRLMRQLSAYTAFEVAEKWPNINFFSGNVTGGVIPGWIFSEYYEILVGREIPNAYMRDTRKAGGHKELITGIKNNPRVKPGDCVLVVEELVNYAETTINAVKVFRKEGFLCPGGACILSYDHPEANKALESNNVELVAVIKMPYVLDVARDQKIFPSHLIDDYQQYLKNPLQWQADRGLTKVEKGGTK